MASVLLPPRQAHETGIARQARRTVYAAISPIPVAAAEKEESAHKIHDGRLHIHFQHTERFFDNSAVLTTYSLIEPELRRHGVEKACGVFVPGNEDAAQEISQKGLVVPGIYYLSHLPFISEKLREDSRTYRFAYVSDPGQGFSSERLKAAVETVVGAGFSRVQMPIVNGQFTDAWINWIKALDGRGIKVYMAHGLQALTSKRRGDAVFALENIADCKNIFLGTATVENSFLVQDTELANAARDTRLKGKIIFESNFALWDNGRPRWYANAIERVRKSVGNDEYIFRKNLERFLE